MARSRRTSKKNAAELVAQTDPRAPLDAAGLLAAAQPVLSLLTADLLERADGSPAVTAALRAGHAEEVAAGRTGDPYEVWRRARMVQIAAAWLLSCVFVRVLEDRGLLGRSRLAGPGAEDSQRLFGELAPYLGPRDYLLTIFRELARIPASAPLFDARHNLIWRLAPSHGGAQALLDLLRAPQADAPAFRFGQPDTRFLGDLYQDLSEDVRKTYALLQTPDFVEAFILDRTLEPAIAEYGVDDATLIDPTCGSGHFLLGAFHRLLDHQRHQHPGRSPVDQARRALANVHGVDLNPYAAAIARFRLTLAYWEAIGVTRLGPQSAPPPLHVVTGDSLLFAAGEQTDFADLAGQEAAVWFGPTFAVDDEEAAKGILRRRYAAVVGNPPYITVKDAALREAYRRLYTACYREYSLSAPFLERFFQLARAGGFTGQITSNAFMKREYGKKVIEEVLPRLELSLVVNTAGAYIPGHGTPTVILFGRNRRPEGKAAERVLAVLSKRGEPSTPEVPAKGAVWSSIVSNWHKVGHDGEYVSVEEVSREVFNRHPWSLEGGGAGQLKELLESRAEATLAEHVSSIGFMCITKQDDIFPQPADVFRRVQAEREHIRTFGLGEEIRDWSILPGDEVIFPYDDAVETVAESEIPNIIRFMWPFRAILSDRKVFGGKTYREAEKPWYEYGQIPKDRLKTPVSIAYAEIATHNHFVLDRGGKVFNRTAPIIKLPEDATEDDHLALLAYLNSSVACFWMKQVAYPKGMHNGSEANATPFLVRFAFDSTKLQKLPLPPTPQKDRERLIALAKAIEGAQAIRESASFATALADFHNGNRTLEESIAAQVTRREDALKAAIAAQEEIDWLVYRLFGLVEKEAVAAPEGAQLAAGERPFEVWLARHDPEAVSTGWFRWSELTPIRDYGAHLPSTYRKLLEERLTRGRSAPRLSLLEDPVAKRRWRQPAGKAAQELETDEKILRDQASAWLEDKIEGSLRGRDAVTVSERDIIELVGREPLFDSVVQWRHPEHSCATFTKKVLQDDSVAFLAAYRYSETGLEKHALWQQTWTLQRREDAGESIPSIPVPPKYDVKDFRDANFFRLRGKLDVPKERFISYPGCESDEDGEPVYGWAGWDHLQRAAALVDLYYRRKDGEGWPAERLTPILAGLLELLPWLKQWHNEPDADGSKMGDEYEAVLDEEVRALGLTRERLAEWRPSGGRARTRASAAASADADADADDDAPAKPPKAKKAAKKAASKRGRPAKGAGAEATQAAPQAADDAATPPAATGKRRGRPPKSAATPPPAAAEQAPPAPAAGPLSLFPDATPAATPRRRGRPKKT